MQPHIFEEQHVEVAEVIENSNKIFVDGRFRVRARGSGIVINDRGFHVWTIRDGMAARSRVLCGPLGGPRGDGPDLEIY
jgi:hypothetical protein